MSLATTLSIRAPDDFHVHVRQGKLLAAMVKATARHFRRAVVMPNTLPPIVTADNVVRYRGEIMEVAPDDFEPLMTIKLVSETTPAIINEAHEVGTIAAKLYPVGVTTNSEDGVSDPQEQWPVFEAMQTVGMVLCIHAEKPESESLYREVDYLPVVHEVAKSFPNLRIVIEHISSGQTVKWLESLQLPNVAATITAHHLRLTLDDVIGDKLEPHHFCKPIAKRAYDRDQLIRAATSGHPRYFLGTDSAPHLRADKECAHGCAGVFTAPLALSAVTETFEEADALGKLEAFTSINGARFYGLPLNEGEIKLVRQQWKVPAKCSGVVPFLAGETLNWKVKEV